jgi:CheY-like chemotaxis protein/anti-sigma regulatory factor (Ser/Thr protein kinase)
VNGDRSRAELSVLVVDDDDDQRFVVVELFRRAGFDRIATAADGAAALRAARAAPPDLVVLDLVMPGRSGFDVLPELRGLLADAQIVVLSNLPRRRLVDAVRRAGATGYVEKGRAPQRLVRDVLLAATLVDAVHASRTFGPDPVASAQARRFVRSTLHAGDTDLVSTVELLVSELVANAVVHAGSGPAVDVVVRDDTVRVEVFDTDPTPPALRTPDPTTPGGRGISIVEHLADSWGTEVLVDGKIVWFEVDRAPAPPTS